VLDEVAVQFADSRDLNARVHVPFVFARLRG
jgi:hypothetical protein